MRVIEPCWTLKRHGRHISVRMAITKAYGPTGIYCDTRLGLAFIQRADSVTFKRPDPAAFHVLAALFCLSTADVHASQPYGLTTHSTGLNLTSLFTPISEVADASIPRHFHLIYIPI